MKRQIRFGIFLLIPTIIVFLILQFGYSLFLKKAYPQHYNEIVEKYSTAYSVRPELIYAVIKSESSFVENAESIAGAIGLMQIMPDTFDWLQTHFSQEYIDCGKLAVPEVNIKFGVYLLSILLNKYGSEATALAAYNAGIGTVDAWLKNKDISPDKKNLQNIPYPETAAYIKKVLHYRDMYRKIYY